MILLVNRNESENKLDYVLKHMGSEEYLEYRERDGLTIVIARERNRLKRFLDALNYAFI